MKKTKIYHLEFVRDIDYVVWEYTQLSETDKTNLANIQFEATFDYIDKNTNYNFLILTDTVQIDRYTKILQDNLVLHFLTDITVQVLKDKLDLDKITSNFDNATLLMWKKFRTKVEKWLLENQELDNVLDLINEKGIENLREIDKKFLENYGN